MSIGLKFAQSVYKEVKRRFALYENGKYVPASVCLVGSVRRQEPVADDIDFLIVLKDRKVSGGLKIGLRDRGPADRVRATGTVSSGPHYTRLRMKAGVRHFNADFFIATSEAKPFALFHYTGDKYYNIRTRALAKKKAWRLNQYGLFVARTDRRVRGSAAIRTERDLAKFLGVTVRPPQLRSTHPRVHAEKHI
jgi:DNA polymerase (family 10)